MVCFRPLTGMVLTINALPIRAYVFSPPCGDGTKTANKTKRINVFSPPYGDGIKSGFEEITQ